MAYCPGDIVLILEMPWVKIYPARQATSNLFLHKNIAQSNNSERSNHSEMMSKYNVDETMSDEKGVDI